MKMVINNYWANGTLRANQPVVFDESGWGSVKEMQSELKGRFPHNQPVLIPNGVRMLLRPGTADYQVITLE